MRIIFTVKYEYLISSILLINLMNDIEERSANIPLSIEHFVHLNSIVDLWSSDFRKKLTNTNICTNIVSV